MMEPDTKDTQPRLSVLLTAGNRRERVANALASVLNQSRAADLEVIVLECGDAEPQPVPGQDRANVRTVRFPQGVSGGYVRAEAVRMARAALVVFLEEHAAACPGWAEAILNDFAAGNWVAVGPEMHNGNAGIGISDIMALRDYPLFESPAQRHEPRWLPLHNTAYRRDAVLRHDADLERLFAVEILLQWRLGAEGGRFLLDPACKVVHYYETDIPTIWRHEVHAQRAFVCNRADLHGWPWWKRAVRLCGAPLILVVRPAKLLALLARRRPHQLRRFLAGLPTIIASTEMACALGEMLGLAFGAGDGDVRYLYHSVNAQRGLPADFPHFRLAHAADER
jgi:glycosyltransferase involved in cell wall biosynthesis